MPRRERLDLSERYADLKRRYHDARNRKDAEMCAELSQALDEIRRELEIQKEADRG